MPRPLANFSFKSATIKMKICLAQTRPLKGDVKGNIENHKKLIDIAASHEADVIIFPELSLTGYEPRLAKELAINHDDPLLDDLQKISDKNMATIGVGAPTKNNDRLRISMIIFQPGQPRKVYSKKYLHSDEDPFFVSGDNLQGLKIKGVHTALAICYELSIAEHTENALKGGAQIYIASVAKHLSGVEKSEQILSDIAKKNSIPVFMSNSVGPSDDFVGAGKTAAWNEKGQLVAQLDDSHEGLLIYDTQTREALKIKQ
jgi:predicted amidohydrolase